MKTYKTIHEAYLGTLADVYDNPEFISEPRGQRTREKLNYQFCVIEPAVEPIKTLDLERNEVIKNYTAKEVALYDSCTNKVKDFAKASSFWTKLANPDETVNSAYGYLIWKNKSHGSNFEQELVNHPQFPEGGVQWYTGKRRTPWEWAKESLIKDKDTRQAVVRFSLPEHFWMGNKDQVCTLHAIFFIREDKLHLTINMRSNDLMLGLVFDAPWFISLMYKMKNELSQTYPNLQIGTYTHFVHSMHLYERDANKILKMLGRPSTT